MADRSSSPAPREVLPSASRRESAIVRSYLEGLRSNRPKRGRQRTRETVLRRLAAIDSNGPAADVIGALRLAQERLDLTAELAILESAVDLGALEAEFVTVAKSYSDRTGISYAAWRTVGVPAATLNAAGVSA